MADLNGRVAIVTGGESGIGAACAQAIGGAGAAVGVFYYKDRAAAEAIATSITAGGGKAAIAQVDVGDEAAVAAGFAHVTQALGPPDLLVNSAGLNMSGVTVDQMALAQWERMLRSDLTGAFLTSRELVRVLKAAGRPGKIVNISSIHGYAVRAGGADYCAAKAGLDALTRTMAVECGPLKINVNGIAPGMVLTPMNQRAETDEAYRKQLEAFIPWGRAGQPGEVADLAVYLCSAQSDYVTGQIVTIDGGLTLEQALGA